MSRDLNQCTFTGRLGSDPELKDAGEGKVCNIGLANNWYKKEGDAWVETTEWIPLVFWNRDAENLAKNIPKGGQILVTGRFQTRKYEKDGVTHYRSEIIVNYLQFLGSRSDNAGAGQSNSVAAPAKNQQGAPPVSQDFDDDIPFAPMRSYP